MPESICDKKNVANQIELSYNLVQKSQTLQTILIYIGLNIKLFEVWNTGKHDGNAVVFFVVDLLKLQKYE